MSARSLFSRAKDSVAHVDFLRYPGVITTLLEEVDKELRVEAEVSTPMTVCVRCGRKDTLIGNGTETQGFWDIPCGIKPCRVSFTKQLYRCKSCGQQSGRDLSFLPASKSRISPRLIGYIHELIDAKINYSQIAQWTGLDESTIRGIRDKRDAQRVVAQESKHTSGFLGLDDWRHGRLRKMRGILVDVVARKPLMLLERITESELQEKLGGYLETHPEVTVIVIDMSVTFRSFLRKHFPHIHIVIDHFHVKQELENKVSRICEQLADSPVLVMSESISQQQELLDASGSSKSASDDAEKKRTNLLAKQFRRYRKVWMKKPDERTERDRNLIRAWTATFPLLEEILESRDAIYRIYETAASSREAKRRFLAWRHSLSLDATIQYEPFIRMVSAWGNEIAAYFDFPERPNNAFTEAMVGEVKRWNDAGRWVSFRVLNARFQNYVMKSQPAGRIDLAEKECDLSPAQGSFWPM